MAAHLTRRIFTVSIALSALLGSALIGGDAGAEGQPFSLSVSNGKAKIGEAGAITVTVTAGKGHKANAEYPHKIKKIKAGAGAEVGASTVPGSVSGKSIRYSVPVTPTAKGSHAVTGQIRFSVCNDTACHIKKVPLNATITGE